VAGPAKAHEIIIMVIAAIARLDDVMHVGGGCQPPGFFTIGTERIPR